MIVRQASLADVSAIAKVHVDAWRTNYHQLKLSLSHREETFCKSLPPAPSSPIP
jgi:hypothetical protein